MRVILATNNKNKAKEVKDILNISEWEIFTLADLNLSSDPEETGSTFLENAMIKAKSALEAANKSGLKDYAIIADDSGLCVNALNGGPGVYSARYAEVNGKKCTYNDNNIKLLDALKDLKDEEREAYFITVAVFIDIDGKSYHVEGRCNGRIAYEASGSNGFGYDPIFLPEAYNYERSMAELSSSEKDAISHRGNAFSNLKKLIE